MPPFTGLGSPFRSVGRTSSVRQEFPVRHVRPAFGRKDPMGGRSCPEARGPTCVSKAAGRPICKGRAPFAEHSEGIGPCCPVRCRGRARGLRQPRSAWSARGAAQKLRRSHAHCRSGSWRSNAFSVSSPSSLQAADVLWRADGGAECDEATHLGAWGGWLPCQTWDPRSAIPGGAGPPIVPKLAGMLANTPLTRSKAARSRVGSGRRQEDVEVDEKGHERRTLPQLRICPA